MSKDGDAETTELGYASASGYDLKLDADDIVVNNELLTIRAVEDYFASDAEKGDPDCDARAATEGPEESKLDELCELVESKMAPGEPALDIKDLSIAGKESERPTSLPLSKPDEEMVSLKKPEGEMPD